MSGITPKPGSAPAKPFRASPACWAGRQVQLLITGSAGLGVAKAAGLDFVQEVYATAAAVRTFIPQADAVIELGGEDAKIIFFGNTLEERMNGSCAGGTGAFIDQMATLLNVTVDELDALSLPPCEDLSHRLPLRGVRQERHPAHPQPGRAEGGRGRLHLPGRGGPDRGRPHPGPGAEGQRSSFWAAPSTSSRACGSGSWTPSSLDERPRRLPPGRRLLCRHRRGPVLPTAGQPAPLTEVLDLLEQRGQRGLPAWTPWPPSLTSQAEYEAFADPPPTP